jgi:cell division protein ZapA
MGQVAITLNDRTYRLVCDDGDEDRLVELAGFVKARVEQVRADVGHVGDERMILMAALMIADELFDAREGAAAEAARASAEAEAESVHRLRATVEKMSAALADGPAASRASPAPGKSRRRDAAG